MDAKEFATKHDLRLETVMVFENPNASEDWEGARHFQYRLASLGKVPRYMIGFFSQGSAHKRPPTMADVLDCLRSDAQTISNGEGFREWCSDLGYEEDSLAAERTYNAIKAQTEDLRMLLGAKAFGELLSDVEPL